MQEVCKKALKTKEGVIELSREVNAIVTTLLPLVQSSKVKQVIQLLIESSDSKQEVNDAGAKLQEAIQKLDPLPESVGVALHAMHLAQRGNPSPAQELARICTLPTPSHPRACYARLNNIQSTLRAWRKQMWEARKEKGSNECSIDFDKLASQLLEISEKGGIDIHSRVLAAECLGEIPLEYYVGESKTTLPTVYSGYAHVTILEMLNTYMADYDMSIVQEATECLRAILLTASGTNALKKLTDEKNPGIWFLSSHH